MESLKHFLKKKEYGAAVEIIERQGRKITVESDADVEYFAVAAFSYYNLRKWSESLFYSGLLLDYLLKVKGPEYEETDLVDCMVEIKFDSLYALRKRVAGYRFLRGIRRQEDLTERMEKAYEMITTQMSETIAAMSVVVAFAFQIIFGTIQKSYNVVTCSKLFCGKYNCFLTADDCWP